MTDDTARGKVELTDEQRAGLDMARHLADLGAPIFRAPADPSSKLGFALPLGWQHAEAGHDAIDAWEPGDALGMVCGHALDAIDVDPRNGGDESAEQIQAAGLWPYAYAQAVTPSGGLHYLVAPLRVAKGAVAPGVDLQSGLDDTTGRAFVFIAPTVRVSKVDGQARAYRWVATGDWSVTADDIAADDSGAPLADRMRALRAGRSSLAVAASHPGATDATGDPFTTPARRFTRAQASAYCMTPLAEFAGWGDDRHGFNARLNELAVMWGHFVPVFISAEVATAQLYAAAERNGSVAYQGAAAVHATIRSGLSAGMRQPYALDDDAEDALGVLGELASDESGEKSAGPTPADELAGRLLTAAAMREQPRPSPLVDGLLDLDSIAWMHGRPGSYKSFVALDLAACVGGGKGWHGRRVAQRPVVYLVAEGAAGMGLRTAAWEQLYGPMIGVWFLPLPIQVSDRAAWATLAAVCKRVEAGLVVIDTQARVTVGLEENSARDMGLFVDALDLLRRETGAAVLAVHHPGKNGTEARGSSAVGGAMSTILRVERTDTCAVTIHLDKQKDGDDAATVELELVRVDGGLDELTARDLSSLAVVDSGTVERRPPRRDWIDNLTPNQGEVAEIIADHMPALGGTKAEIKAVLLERRTAAGRPEMARGSFARAFDSLAERGLIGRVKGTQRWRIVEPDEEDETA